MTATETAPLPAPIPAHPEMPYAVEDRAYGADGRLLPTKVYPQGGGMLMTTEELLVVEYVGWLEAENKRLAGINEEYRQVVQNGRRLPDPGLSQDPAFAAFFIAGLEKAASVAPDTPPTNIGGVVTEQDNPAVDDDALPKLSEMRGALAADPKPAKAKKR